MEERQRLASELSERLKALGSNAPYHEHSARTEPDASLLERFESPAEGHPWEFEVAIESSEFTSLCPITGQPDWATIKIKYAPKKWCVESKSLKLYLMSYRNHGSFHEVIVDRICADLVALLDPEWLEVRGEFTPRGGIPFWPRAYYYQNMGRPQTIKVEAKDGIAVSGEMSQLELDDFIGEQGG